jgi:hypothetical protein
VPSKKQFDNFATGILRPVLRVDSDDAAVHSADSPGADPRICAFSTEWLVEVTEQPATFGLSFM